MEPFALDQVFGSRPLFVERKGFAAWLAGAKAKMALLQSADAVQSAMATHAARDREATMIGDTAVIDVCGPIAYRSSWLSMLFGMAAIEDLQAKFRAAMADTTVKTIVFRVDSPGGVVDMMPEFADEIFAARKKGKRIVAVADTLAASCAYWLASQADEIYATASSELGAIGVFCEHAEYSKMLDKAGITITLISYGAHKTDGNPYEPLSEAARADMQASVDEIGGWFDKAVARGRGVSVDVVQSQFGQGKVFRGAKAISLGLADKTGTFGQVLASLNGQRSGGVRGSQPSPAVVDVAALGHEVAAAVRREVLAVASDETPEDEQTEVEPNEDGSCPDGYTKGDDGMCHLAVPADDDEEARRDAEGILAALGRVRG